MGAESTQRGRSFKLTSSLSDSSVLMAWVFGVVRARVKSSGLLLVGFEYGCWFVWCARSVGGMGYSSRAAANGSSGSESPVGSRIGGGERLYQGS